MQVLYFGAPWCGPCKTFKPLVEQTTRELGVQWTDINVDYDPNISQKYQVTSIPTLVILNNQGEVAYRHTGVMAKSQLEAAFNTFK
jgi:thioredoxin-like negative regulator of GroEL